MSLPKPQSRAEDLLQAIATGRTQNLPKPQSRVEMYLKRIATGVGPIPTKPLSRMEQYLDYIVKHGGGTNPEQPSNLVGIAIVGKAIVD